MMIFWTPPAALPPQPFTMEALCPEKGVFGTQDYIIFMGRENNFQERLLCLTESFCGEIIGSTFFMGSNVPYIRATWWEVASKHKKSGHISLTF